MNGLEFLHALAAGEVPAPGLAVTLGFRPVAASDGRVTFELSPDERHTNPLGTVHGGVISALLDSALGCAVHTTLPAGAVYTTLQLDVKFVRPALPGQGRLIAEGVVVHAGRRTATAEGRVVDERGIVYAHGTTTCLITREG
jgi:uncharacterized protein (TIGR00369 family)